MRRVCACVGCRYTYNCLIHLCGVLARCDDALDILTHMQSEAQQNLECKPDSYTFRCGFACMGAGSG